MYELVTLDMAGTTIDDRGLVYDALRQSVEETGASVAQSDLQEWMGTDKVTAIKELLSRGGGDPTRAQTQFERFREILAQAYAATPPVPIPGVEQAIRDLRDGGIKVALTTGFDRVVVEPTLDLLGWGTLDARPRHVVVDAVVTTDDVAAGRPAPYMIFRAMEAAGVANVRAVVSVGDTVADLRAGRNSGGVAVGVLTGKAGRAALAAEDHDHLIQSVADLPALLG